MRIHHVLAASAAVLLAIPSWAQSSSEFDPTGSVWLREQIVAARRSASSEDSAAARRAVAHSGVVKTDEAPKKKTELDRPGRTTHVGAAATAR